MTVLETGMRLKMWRYFFYCGHNIIDGIVSDFSSILVQDPLMLYDGEPAFFGMFLIFAILVLLGIAQNQGILPPLHY